MAEKQGWPSGSAATFSQESCTSMLEDEERTTKQPKRRRYMVSYLSQGIQSSLLTHPMHVQLST